jgi:hypothetical protein
MANVTSQDEATSAGEGWYLHRGRGILLLYQAKKDALFFLCMNMKTNMFYNSMGRGYLVVVV